MKVLVTRSQPAASRTAKNLEKNGLEPLVIPLFEIVDTGTPIPKCDHDGIVFTSSNAVAILAARGWTANSPDMPAFCVGERTASAAHELGYKETIVAAGGGEALAKRILEDKSRDVRRLLYPAPVERSFDMKAALFDAGIEVTMAEIYEHRVKDEGLKQLGELNRELEDCIVTAFSTKSAIISAECLFDRNPNIEKQRLRLVSISQKCANSVLKYPWHDVYVAKEPNEQAMIEEIKKLTLRKES